MDADTRELLAGSIRALLRAQPGGLVAGLAELGWDEVVSDDEPAAVELLFTEQGRAGAASAALDDVMIRAAGLSSDRLLVVHPLGGSSATRIDDEVRVDGVVLTPPSPGARYVCAALAVAVGDVAPARPVSGFDPASALHRVRFTVGIGAVFPAVGDWDDATSAARRALASELVGSGDAMLAIAVDHVSQRNQFGRPVGANQTPRHRLADAYVQVTAARELVRIAWASGTSWDARVAKAYAGQAVDTTSRACLQVCGAMGLTAEHPLGGFVKRSRILDALYGGWQHSMRTLGSELLASRTVPQGVRV